MVEEEQESGIDISISTMVDISMFLLENVCRNVGNFDLLQRFSTAPSKAATNPR